MPPEDDIGMREMLHRFRTLVRTVDQERSDISLTFVHGADLELEEGFQDQIAEWRTRHEALVYSVADGTIEVEAENVRESITVRIEQDCHGLVARLEVCVSAPVGLIRPEVICELQFGLCGNVKLLWRQEAALPIDGLLVRIEIVVIDGHAEVLNRALRQLLKEVNYVKEALRDFDGPSSF